MPGARRNVSTPLGLLALLLENELFSDMKKARLSGNAASKEDRGEGGTIFLDENRSISLKTQTDLLRVWQEHEITRAVAGNQVINTDFRCVAATNKNLENMI